jgi:hypothetical protein
VDIYVVKIETDDEYITDEVVCVTEDTALVRPYATHERLYLVEVWRGGVHVRSMHEADDILALKGGE